MHDKLISQEKNANNITFKLIRICAAFESLLSYLLLSLILSWNRKMQILLCTFQMEFVSVH